ncbi:MAG: 2-iminoacetate synthase ThiH [Verrucomicrobia bacterium]|nr:2-iminoacetate synthase ThiH [Verrucomicrobiota bacterium]
MSFVATFNSLDLTQWVDKIEATSAEEVDRVLSSGETGINALGTLISAAAAERLEGMSQRSQQITQQRFGKVIRMFAPLYLSNECINNCSYCGFSRDNPILRVTLSVDEVCVETQALVKQGFRNILLVAGEHPKFVSNGYLESCLRALRDLVPGLSLEVGPMETDEYRKMVEAGAEGLVVYQETYNRELYAKMHTAGPKKDFDWRLETPERAYSAGFRRLGIGALFGLADWRQESMAVAAHASYLLRHCWKSQLTIAFPRLRPCAGEFQPIAPLEDRTLVQLLAAFRIAYPDIGLVLSTREPAWLRDGLIPLGVTLMSAGSHTEPGGYTGAGQENLHVTERGRVKALEKVSTGDGADAAPLRATGQFDIADERDPGEIAALIRRLGYEPVWKDWDAALSA